MLFQTVKNNPELKPLLELITLFLGAIIPIVTIGKMSMTAIKRYLDFRTLRSRIGSDQYTRNDILRATNCFVEPHFQSVDPSGGEGFRKVFSTCEPAFKALDNLFDMDSSEKYTIILADSGMGKTTLLLNYYARHCTRHRDKFNLAIVALGSNSADETIKSIRDRKETILFLDAFDEDTLAVPDYRKRLAALLEKTKGFRHVLITCRTQFFEKSDEIPQETGFVRIGVINPGEEREYKFQKLYLTPFSNDQVKLYLKRRFPLWRIVQRRKAMKIAEKIPDLTMRPMLLAHIRDLLSSRLSCDYSVQIYESMIKA
jgi:hypothetical protein